jgi:sugar phosphate isomerase/epimerase
MFGMTGDVDERVAAAAAAGFTDLSISPLDHASVDDAGTTPQDVARRARDLGVDISVIDPILTWVTPDEPPPGPLGEFTVDDVLRIGDAFGVTATSAIVIGADDVPVEAIAERFAALCDRVADHGWVVQLEFVPMSAVKDVATAWEIARLADRPNGGILVDSWHFFRGRPDFDALDAVPGDRVFAVQLDDAAAEVQGSMWDDTLRHRLLPGDGVFDLRRLIRALHDIGGLTAVGPEVISERMRALPPVEAARLAAEATLPYVTDVTHFDAGEEAGEFYFGETPEELLDRLAREREERERAAAESRDENDDDDADGGDA